MPVRTGHALRNVLSLIIFQAWVVPWRCERLG